jgi:hypothetical protein
MSVKDLTAEEQTVTISLREYNELLEASRWLQCLEDAGVDGWSGIDYAQSLSEDLE